MFTVRRFTSTNEGGIILLNKNNQVVTYESYVLELGPKGDCYSFIKGFNDAQRLQVINLYLYFINFKIENSFYIVILGILSQTRKIPIVYYLPKIQYLYIKHHLNQNLKEELK